VRQTDGRTDRQTYRLAHKICRTPLRCAAKNIAQNKLNCQKRHACGGAAVGDIESEMVSKFIPILAVTTAPQNTVC